MFFSNARAPRRAMTLLMGVFVLSLVSCRKVDTLGPGETLPVESRFSTSVEGWTSIGDGVLSRIPQNGNPGGYLSLVDQVNGPPQTFSAPAAFLGNKSAAYGLLLTFDLKWTGENPAEQPENAGVTLRGAGHTLITYFEHGPAAAWTPFALRLDESTEWIHAATGQPATAAQIQAALGSLQQLLIRGEYNEGMEQTGLDNVVFGVEG